MRDKNDSSIVILTQSAFVQRDGDVVDVDGISPIKFLNIPDEEFFIAIRHRNHLGIMSQNPINLCMANSEIDFSNPTFEVYGNEPQKEINGVNVLWAGDVKKMEL